METALFTEEELTVLVDQIYVDESKSASESLIEYLEADVKKLDRIRNIDYRGIQGIYDRLLALGDEFEDEAIYFGELVQKLIALDLSLERDDDLPVIKMRIDSARNGLNELASRLESIGQTGGARL